MRGRGAAAGELGVLGAVMQRPANLGLGEQHVRWQGSAAAELQTVLLGRVGGCSEVEVSVL